MSPRKRIMATSAVLAVLLAVALWQMPLSRGSGAGGDSADRGATRDAPQIRGARDRGQPDWRPRALSRSGPPAARQPRIAAPHVAFDRSPKRADELDEIYQRRMRVSEAFERFRRESGISEDRAQKLLLILYDFQEGFRLYEREAEEAQKLTWEEHEHFLYETLGWRRSMQWEAYERVHALLTPAERRVWRRTLVEANIWLVLGLWPMLRP